MKGEDGNDDRLVIRGDANLLQVGWFIFNIQKISLHIPNISRHIIYC